MKSTDTVGIVYTGIKQAKLFQALMKNYCRRVYSDGRFKTRFLETHEVSNLVFSLEPVWDPLTRVLLTCPQTFPPQLWALTGCHTLISNLDAARSHIQEVNSWIWATPGT